MKKKATKKKMTMFGKMQNYAEGLLPTKESASRGVSIVAVFAMVMQTLFPTMAFAADELSPGSLTGNPVSVCSDENGYRVSLSGTGSVNPLEWSSLGHYIRVDWGNDSAVNSDTSGSGATDGFYSPDFGKTLVGSWTATTTYAVSGTYDVTVEMYLNPDQPPAPPVGIPAEENLDNDILKATLNILVDTSTATPCNPPVEEEPVEEPELPLDISVNDIVVCTENGGVKVSLAGQGGGAPLEWSSLGHYVRVTWDDGGTSYSDTSGSGVTDGFYTPDFGKSLKGSWKGTHTYASPGSYDVIIQMYLNPNQPPAPPVKSPILKNLNNDILKAMTTITVDTTDAPPCNSSGGGGSTNSSLTIQKVWNTETAVTPAVSIKWMGSQVELDPETLTTIAYTQPAGTYSLTEDPVAGFTSSIVCNDGTFNSETGALTLEDGDSVTCIVTNTEIVDTDDGDENDENGEEGDDEDTQGESGTITVVKDTMNDDDGIYGTTNFLLTVSWTVGDSTSSQSFRGSTAGVVVNIPEGASYEVTESPYTAIDTESGPVANPEVSHGYTATMSGSCSGTMGSGAAVSCTVTNNDPEQPTSNGGGGSGGSVNGAGFTGDGGSGNLSANNAVGGGDSFEFGEPRILGVQDTDETILTCAEQYPEAALITGALDDLLAAYGFTRNTGLEQALGGSILPKILLPGTPMTNEQILQNFIVYGIQTLIGLGAGERAGIVASFTLLYNRLPQNECDWQNVIRIGQGVVPVVLAPEREAFIEDAFEEIYDRAADRAVPQDNVTVLIMTYGLRPDVRSLSAEFQAATIFKGIYGGLPRTTNEWDITRGIAYGGLTVPGYSPIVR